MNHSRIISTEEQGELLEPDQLALLEQSFKQWAVRASKGRLASRTRILLIFLLIRYTGAKLNEVLGLHAQRDIKLTQRIISYKGGEDDRQEARNVDIAQSLAEAIDEYLRLAGAAADVTAPDADAPVDANHPLAIDPAFVRKKFYERAKDCGLNPRRCGPEMVRKARALELLRNNMPLPVVQRLLGHSSPGLTASHLTFSEEDIQQVARWFMERESGRKTSARNSFFGKVDTVAQDKVQSLVEIATPEGIRIRTMITNSSAERLGLKPGRLVSAEIKAPWLALERADRPGCSSADNVCKGVISEITLGEINVECEVSIHDGMKLCAILSTPGFDALGLHKGDFVRVLFSCYAVILHVD